MIDPTGSIAFPDRPQPPISNGKLGMMLLVGTETILFTCFISAYMVLRMGALTWPPIGTPSLHIGLSAVNTGVLVLSAFMAFAARRATNRGKKIDAGFFLAATLALGTLFLVLQGVEFHHLYARGLTLQRGPYGAVFFCLAGCHGLHVLGGLIFLGVILFQLIERPERIAKIREWVGYSELYWYFVTVVWLILFGILYVL